MGGLLTMEAAFLGGGSWDPGPFFPLPLSFASCPEVNNLSLCCCYDVLSCQGPQNNVAS